MMLMAFFNAAAALSAFLQNVTRSGTAVSPANATASFRMNSSGVAQSAPTSGTYADEFTWLTEGANSDFESRMTTVSGSLTSGTAATWEALSTTRTWSRNRTSDVAGTTTYVGTLEIRRVSDSVVVASCTITLNATVTDFA